MSDDIKTDVKQTESEDKSEKKRDPVRTYSEDAFKQLVAERDEAKKKARAYEEAEKKLADEKALSEGRAKELLEAREKELAEVKARADAMELADAERKKHLLEKVEDADKKAIYAKLSTNDLEKIIEKESQLKVKTDAGKHPVTGLLEEDVKDFRTWQEKLRQKGLAQ